MRSISFPTLAIFVFGVVVACGKDGQAREPAEPVPMAQPDAGKQYTVVVAPVQLKVGATATVSLTIKPNKGLHFNEEFPAKFTVEATAFAKCPKDKLTAKTGEVKVAGGQGTVAIPLTGVAAGAGNIKVTGNFSVCSDEQCYMLRGEILTVPVTVQ